MITKETPALVELLGENNVEKLREKITLTLIDEIESEIKENYLIDSETIRDSINSMVNGILSSLKKKYKDDLTEIIEAKFREELRVKHMLIELPVGTRFFDEYGNCFETIESKGGDDYTECDIRHCETFLCCVGERNDKTDVFFRRVRNRE